MAFLLNLSFKFKFIFTFYFLDNKCTPIPLYNSYHQQNHHQLFSSPSIQNSVNFIHYNPCDFHFARAPAVEFIFNCFNSLITTSITTSTIPITNSKWVVVFNFFIRDYNILDFSTNF